MALSGRMKYGHRIKPAIDHWVGTNHSFFLLLCHGQKAPHGTADAAIFESTKTAAVETLFPHLAWQFFPDRSYENNIGIQVAFLGRLLPVETAKRTFSCPGDMDRTINGSASKPAAFFHNTHGATTVRLMPLQMHSPPSSHKPRHRREDYLQVWLSHEDVRTCVFND